MDEEKVQTSGKSVFAKEVTVSRGEKPVTSKDVANMKDVSPQHRAIMNKFYAEQDALKLKQKNNVSRGNSYATENIARSNYDKDKRKGMSPNDLAVKYRKF